MSPIGTSVTPSCVHVALSPDMGSEGDMDEEIPDYPGRARPTAKVRPNTSWT
jgi:hypothetical protein